MTESNQRVENYNEFCKSKECPEYIEWDYGFDSDSQPYPCVSCQRVGQSYDVEKYPADCPYLHEIELIEIDTQPQLLR